MSHKNKLYEIKESKVIDTDDGLIYTGNFKKTHREPRSISSDAVVSGQGVLF